MCAAPLPQREPLPRKSGARVVGGSLEPGLAHLWTRGPGLAAVRVLPDPASAPGVGPPSAPAADDAFARFVRAMVSAALAAGATRAAADLPGLLGAPAQADVTSASLPPKFLRTARAWRSVLLGTSQDLSACGAATLDEWGAELLASLLAAPQRKTELRRALRQQGVAAFGMLEAA